MRGSMTVWFCLLAGVVLSLSTTCIWSVQHAMFRFRAAESMDLALYSLFAQYDTKLLEEYDLFFQDASYGSGQFQPAQVLSVMECYVNKNGQTLEAGGFTEYAFATDQNGNVWKEQAVSYMKDYGKVQSAVSLLQELQMQKQMTESQDALQEQIREEQLLETYEQQLATPSHPEDGEQVPEVPVQVMKNPIDTIKEVKKMGILALVLPDVTSLSGKTVERASLLSGRECNVGLGSQETISFSPMDHLLYQEYCLQRLGCYGEEAVTGALTYQLEYMLGGEDSDEANLKRVVQRLLLMREASNYAFLSADPASRQQLSAFATALSATLAIPEAAAVVEVLLRLCWAYGESLMDVRILLAGGRVPLVKDSDSWQLSLNSLADVVQKLESADQTDNNGMRYKEYLRLLLYLQGSNRQQTMRSLDMIESSLRAIPGKEEFRLDCCICSLGVEGQMTDLWGQNYRIQRNYQYVY